MQSNIDFSNFDSFECDALALIAFEQTQQAHPWIQELVQNGEFKGKALDAVILHHPVEMSARRLVALGGGKADKFTPAELRKAAGALIRAVKPRGYKHVALVLSEAFQYPDYVAAAAEGALLAVWEPDRLKSKKDDAPPSIEQFTLVCPDGMRELSAPFRKGQTLAQAQNLARDLANDPPNILTPMVLAGRARDVAAAEGLECDILDAPRMRQLGMGALLGVAQGSAEPPCLIHLGYRPSTPSAVHLAIVGKAVTFDTGGISIKPADGMEQMKYDMAGGAAAIAAMQAIARLKPPIQVSAFIPSAENMPDAKAQRPGDIVTSLSGKTIEILNTDAEGRLILADAITYAKQQGVTHIIDAATLTGAIVHALGSLYSGVFSNNEPFQRRVLDAASQQGEKMWALPMDEEYREMLKSAFADIPNIGSKGAGSITGAKFIEEFAGDTPWAHLDIAGTAWLNEPKPYLAKGPTGVAVRTFVELAINWEQ